VLVDELQLLLASARFFAVCARKPLLARTRAFFGLCTFTGLRAVAPPG
jgi:hypothetical protein